MCRMFGLQPSSHSVFLVVALSLAVAGTACDTQAPTPGHGQPEQDEAPGFADSIRAGFHDCA